MSREPKNPYDSNDLSDFWAVCRDEEVNIEDYLNCNSKRDDYRIKALLEQYKALVDVYLQNHREYREIQGQIMTILSAIAGPSALLTYWFFKGNILAILGIFALTVFTVFIKKPLSISIHKNRHYHTFTAFTIRAIEDKLKIYNIPLRTKDYGNSYWKYINKNEDNVGRVTSRSWKEIIPLLFNSLFGILLFISVFGLFFIICRAMGCEEVCKIFEVVFNICGS